MAISKLTQATVETFLMAGIGCGSGLILQVNPGLTASLFAILTIANHILFEAADRWARPLLNTVTKSQFIFSSELTYACTTLAVSAISFVAAQQLEILSKRLAGVFIFVSCGTFLGRLRTIYDPIEVKAKVKAN